MGHLANEIVELCTLYDLGLLLGHMYCVCTERYVLCTTANSNARLHDSKQKKEEKRRGVCGGGVFFFCVHMYAKSGDIIHFSFVER